MQLKILKTPAEMDSLAVEWNDLLAKSASDVPFLRHEYLRTWWSTLGGAEWTHGDLYVVTARQESGTLMGIAPLFFSENREGEPALMLLGSIEISDYLDIIAPPEDLTPFLGALLEHLSGPSAPAWHVLDWYNLPEGSPTLAALGQISRGCGWSYEQERLQHCPTIPLSGDWETYLSGIDKKQRHEVRRKMRRAESAEPPVSWYMVEDEAALDEEMGAFFELMSQDVEKQNFLTGPMRAQLRATARAAFQADWLQLAFLKVGDEKAAGYMNFDYNNHIWVYNSGIDPRFSAISPGWVLLGNLLQWANQKQRAAFDFMRGDEDYKYRFGGIDRFVVRAKVRR
jgi:CelD/BcsL family acetyltransferase involved in cellulose biosynthesis